MLLEDENENGEFGRVVKEVKYFGCPMKLGFSLDLLFKKVAILGIKVKASIESSYKFYCYVFKRKSNVSFSMYNMKCMKVFMH